jgi:hypothetical protein
MDARRMSKAAVMVLVLAVTVRSWRFAFHSSG